MSAYCARVARARAESGLSLRLLAAKVGLSVTHLYDIEKGRRSPSPGIRARLDAALGLKEEA